jgi:hypothetical protein
MLSRSARLGAIGAAVAAARSWTAPGGPAAAAERSDIQADAETGGDGS